MNSFREDLIKQAIVKDYTSAWKNIIGSSKDNKEKYRDYIKTYVKYIKKIDEYEKELTCNIINWRSILIELDSYLVKLIYLSFNYNNILY